MFRLATSKVSAVSGCVANGRQTMHHVSCSPSEIPYVGFSPVRLQTGIQSRPSPQCPGLKLRASIRPKRDGLYTARVQAPAAKMASREASRRMPVRCSRSPERSSPEVLRSPAGYVVPPGPRYYDLIRNSRNLPPAYLLRPGGSLPDGFVWAGPERLPNLLRVSVLPCRRPYPGGHGDCTRPVLRHHHWPSSIRERLGIHKVPIADSQGLCNEAATFASCYGPEDCWPSIGKDFYGQAFIPAGRPAGMLVMTTRATSQFPGPDSHRQDTRPYGLRHGGTETRRNEGNDEL